MGRSVKQKSSPRQENGSEQDHVHTLDGSERNTEHYRAHWPERKRISGLCGIGQEIRLAVPFVGEVRDEGRERR